MPWKASEAKQFTRKANTPKKQKLWREVANKALKRGVSDESAIRQASAVVAGTAKHGKQRRHK
jgi:hypothetical protein